MKTGQSFVVNHLKKVPFCPFLPILQFLDPTVLSPSLFSLQSQHKAHHNSQEFATLPCPLFLCGGLLASRFSVSLTTECWPLAQLCPSGDLDKFPVSKPHPSSASHPFFDSSFPFPTSTSLSAVLLIPCSFQKVQGHFFIQMPFSTLRFSSAQRKRTSQNRVGLEKVNLMILQADGNALSQGIILVFIIHINSILESLFLFSPPARPIF